jgi:hypothetical protein
VRGPAGPVKAAGALPARDQHRDRREDHLPADQLPLRPTKIAMYLKRYHGIQISDSGVWRILKRLGMNRLSASHRYKPKDRRWKRYEKQLPGHHVQIDVKFIAPITTAPARRDRAARPRGRCCRAQAEEVLPVHGHWGDELASALLAEWENFYNYHRPHRGLGGQTPYEWLRQKTQTPVQRSTSAAHGHPDAGQRAVPRHEGRPSFRPCVTRASRASRPGFQDLCVRVGREVHVPMCGRVVLVPEQRLDVQQRHPSCTSQDEAVCRMIRGGNRRIPAALIAGYQTRLRKCPSLAGPPSGAVNTRASRGRPAISTDMRLLRLWPLRRGDVTGKPNDDRSYMRLDPSVHFPDHARTAIAHSATPTR